MELERSIEVKESQTLSEITQSVVNEEVKSVSNPFKSDIKFWTNKKYKDGFKIGGTKAPTNTQYGDLEQSEFFDPRKWTLDMFEIGRPLGRGGYGKAYLARTKKEKFLVCLKKIKKSRFSSHNYNSLARELEIGI